MKYLAGIALYLFFTLGILNLAPHRVQMLWLLPWLTLDCIGSWVIGESFDNTLSAKAWDARTHTRWYWTHRFIDGLFGSGHCHVQWLREQHYKTVWASWAAQWRGEVIPDGAFTDEQLEA